MGATAKRTIGAVRRGAAAWPIGACLATWLLCACDDPGSAAVAKANLERGAVSISYKFTASKDGFAISANGGAYKPFWPYGLNFSATLPGRTPGQYEATADQLRRWIETAGEMGCNTLRTHTVQSPDFYRELRRYNLAHPGKPIFLLQGAWFQDPLDDPDAAKDPDYLHPNLLKWFKDEIDKAVQAVHGDIVIAAGDAKTNPLNFGRAFGNYTADVSPWLLGYLIGREFDPVVMANTAKNHAGSTFQGGNYFAIDKATVIETFIAGSLDYVATLEQKLYGQQHPLGYVNAPATDPIVHYTEPKAPSSFDEYQTIDLNKLQVKPAFAAGVFIAYHAFAFYPDFVMYQPEYAKTSDADGPNPYLGYLQDLRKTHGNFALLIAETGHPSSQGCAHYSPAGLNHGGYNELEQGYADLRSLKTVAQSGASGALLDGAVDEWFHSSWLTAPVALPSDRQRLWHNVQNANQHFGMVALLPNEATRTHMIDGKQGDWAGKQPQLVKNFPLLSPRSDGFDDMRTLQDVTVDHDAAFLHVRLRVKSLDPDGDGKVQWDRADWVIGIDTIDPLRGDSRLDAAGKLQSERRMEFQVRIQSDTDVQLWVDRPYDLFGVGQGPASHEPWQKYRSVANDDGQWLLVASRTNGEYAWKEIISATESKWHPLAGQLAQETGRFRTGPEAANSASNFWYDIATGVMELRIPWALLNVADPSDRRVIDDQGHSAPALDTAQTEKFGIVAASYSGQDEAEIEVADTLPVALPAVAKDGSSKAWRIPATGSIDYQWPVWNSPPAYHERRKAAFFVLRDHGQEVLPAAAKTAPP